MIDGCVKNEKERRVVGIQKQTSDITPATLKTVDFAIIQLRNSRLEDTPSLRRAARSQHEFGSLFKASCHEPVSKTLLNSHVSLTLRIRLKLPHPGQTP